MRKGIVAHATCIDDTNVGQLGDFDTVFLCMDGHPVKARILEVCLANDTLLIDVGMGLHRAGDSPCRHSSNDRLPLRPSRPRRTLRGFDRR